MPTTHQEVGSVAWRHAAIGPDISELGSEDDQGVGDGSVPVFDLVDTD